MINIKCKRMKKLTRPLSLLKRYTHSCQCPKWTKFRIWFLSINGRYSRHLFSQVDDHNGVACDSSSRVRRGIFDPLPVVNPVDLQRRCTYVWGLAFFSSCLVGNGPWVLGILLLHIRRSPTHPPQRFGFLAPETIDYLWCKAQQAVSPLSIIEGDTLVKYGEAWTARLME